MRYRLGTCLVGLAVCLAGCSGPVGLYHSVEGGAIAQNRAPPPGQNLPYPNLADVPPPALPVTPAEEAAATARASGAGVTPASPEALAGLDLPAVPPPPPGIEPTTPAAPAAPAAPQAALPAFTPPAPPPPGPATPLAFPAHSAILPAQDLPALQAIAASRNGATIQAGGFGDNTSLTLALARAERLADALTAVGVPASAIQLKAQEAGTGGFVRFVY